MKLAVGCQVRSRLCSTYLTRYFRRFLKSLLARIFSTSYSSTLSTGIEGGFGASCPGRGSFRSLVRSSDANTGCIQDPSGSFKCYKFLTQANTLQGPAYLSDSFWLGWSILRFQVSNQTESPTFQLIGLQQGFTAQRIRSCVFLIQDFVIS